MTKCKFCGKKFDDDKIVSVKLLNGEIVDSCESCKAKCLAPNKPEPQIQYPVSVVLKIILIYFLTFIVGTILNIILGIITGIKLGAALLYIVEFALAHKLTAKVEEKFMRSKNNNLKNYKF